MKSEIESVESKTKPKAKTKAKSNVKSEDGPVEYTNAKHSKDESSTRVQSETVFTLAKKIRNDTESWQDAIQRAKYQFNHVIKPSSVEDTSLRGKSSMDERINHAERRVDGDDY